MAKGTSKKAAISKAKMAANQSTINAVANNARKGKKKKKKKATANPKSVAEAYSTYNKTKKPKTSRAKLVKKDDSSNAKKKQGKGKHSKTSKGKMGIGKKSLIVIATAAIVIFGLTCLAFAADEQMRSQFVPETTTLDGQIDISGMTRDELRELLENRVENGVETSIIVKAGDAAQEIDMNEIGEIDIEATIDQAFGPYQENPVLRMASRAGELLTGQIPNRYVALNCVVDEEALVQRVEQACEELNRPAKNAGYEYNATTNSLVIADAKQGLQVDTVTTTALVEDALRDVKSDDPHRLSIEAETIVTEPESFEAGQGIFVDTRNCRVTLYEGGEAVVSYPCTPGTSGYATPTGDFFLSYKDGSPTWYNPHSAWSAGMPETIAPGPSNPLGVRALAVSCGDGIYLHGTTNTGHLGSPGSHGCVRLSNANITDLYDRVSQGIPIIIR